MSVENKDILNRLYFVSGCLFVFMIIIVGKLFVIQFVDGDYYKGLAEKRAVKNVVIPANRGNIYASDGSLLATSVPKYDIRFDALAPTHTRFEKYLNALADSLAVFDKTHNPVYFEQKLRKARLNKNRYFLIRRNVGYSDYLRLRNFPLLNLGAFKGGLIVEQTTKREHPMGAIAQRTIGYERIDKNGNITRPGIDGAFGVKYLRGTDGHRLKQKIGNGQWKPITDYDQVEPKDGFDVVTTLEVNIQDIAHHALLSQLENYKADHGSVVVMEVATGEIKAISNLGRNKKGKYYERLNYAVGETHEPGSTFKLMALAVALEDKVIDTTTIVDTKKGVLSFYGRKVRDSKNGGYGKISVAEAFEVSSNTGIVSAIHNSYKGRKGAEKFVDGLYKMHLQDTLKLPLIGEEQPIIPDPRIKNNRWSGIALEWMAYGYGVSFTPLQTLTFYNAVANNGTMVRPQFLKEIREFGKPVKVFEKEIIDPQICSLETISKLKQLLANVVKKPHGTGHRLYSNEFSMAGKTGTCQKNYTDKDKLNYISSFVGFFPVDKPKYSCIVVIHEPDQSLGYYGADVSGPVFKRIAQKIHTDAPLATQVQIADYNDTKAEASYESYFDYAQKYKTIMPDVTGMPLMDAMVLLENMGLMVSANTVGQVKSQSIRKGTKVKPNQKVTLKI